MVVVKGEDRYRRLAYIQLGRSAVPCDKARQQFVEHQSHGTIPENPRLYYEMLSVGKSIWDWTVEQYRQDRFTDAWPGWAQIEHDFRDDPEGLRMVEKACHRHDKQPALRHDRRGGGRMVGDGQ